MTKLFRSGWRLVLMLVLLTAPRSVAAAENPDHFYFNLSPIEILLPIDGYNYRLLSVEITVEVTQQKDLAQIDALKAKIATALKHDMQVYGFEQVQGQHGVRLFKEVALASVRRTVAPVVVPEVLIKKFLLH